MKTSFRKSSIILGCYARIYLVVKLSNTPELAFFLLFWLFKSFHQHSNHMPEQACDCSIPFPKATAVLLNYCWMTVESHDET